MVWCPFLNSPTGTSHTKNKANNGNPTMSTFGTQSHVQTSARYPFLAETQQGDLFRIPSPISATTLYVSLLEDMSLLGDSTANSKKKNICIYICIIKCIEHNCINIHTYIKDIIKMQIPKKTHRHRVQVRYRSFQRKKPFLFSPYLQVLTSSRWIPWFLTALVVNPGFRQPPICRTCLGLLERMDPFCN